MKNKLKILYISILIMIGCSVSIEEIRQEKSEPIIDNNTNIQAQYSNKELITTVDNQDTHPLNKIQLKNWTDKYVPFTYDSLRLYSAYLYSTQPESDGHQVITIYSNADHWNKIHLLTLSEEYELLDHIELASDFSVLAEQTENIEQIHHDKKYSKMISSNEYEIYNIKTVELIDYEKDTTTYQTDSITTKFKPPNISCTQ